MLWVWIQIVRHNRNVTHDLLRPTHGSTEIVEIVEVSLSGRGKGTREEQTDSHSPPSLRRRQPLVVMWGNPRA